MPNYRRWHRPGGNFFFTLVTHQRRPFLCDDSARRILRQAIEQCQERHPFTIEAIVLIPDHIHPLIRLPDGDPDYSLRIASIKANFTRQWLAATGAEIPQSMSRRQRRHRGVWQKRFWEHRVDDPRDFEDHLNYIHYNPVKHGLVTCPHLWPYSTFRKWVRLGLYPLDWLCVCGGRKAEPPRFGRFEGYEME
jgi:putative transposase